MPSSASVAPVDPLLTQQVNDVAELAYRHVAERYGTYSAEEMYFKPECLEVSRFMLSSLIDNGYEVREDNAVSFYEPLRDEQGRAIKFPDNNPGHCHIYLVLVNDGTELILDATWQQYLPAEKRTPDVPKVLIGSRAEIVEKAREFGIDDEVILKLWKSLRVRKGFPEA